MYRIPKDLDLAKIVGETTSQIRVGQFDLQFTFGPVRFSVESALRLFRDNVEIGKWEGGTWPDAGFYELMNSNATGYEIPNDRLLVVRLENGLEIHFRDDSDQFECFQISVDGEREWVI